MAKEFKITITDEEKIRLEQWRDESYCLEAVEADGYALQYVKEQTEAICLKAVEADGYALRYVKEQTEAICLKAVERNGYALQYVKEQTEAICLKAVEADGYALRYVKDVGAYSWIEISESQPIKTCPKCGHTIGG